MGVPCGLDKKQLFAFFSSRFKKEEAVALLRKRPVLFEFALEFALGKSVPQAWRASWIIYHTMRVGDKRIQNKQDAIIAALPSKGAGHQRELLKIVSKIRCTEKSQGILYAYCSELWENIQLLGSLRYMAYKFMFDLSQQYPELKQEILLLTEDHYVQTLSPGIRKSIKKLALQLV